MVLSQHCCDDIVIDYTQLSEDVYEIPIALEIHDIYPETPLLRSTADAGCELCRLFIHTVHEKAAELSVGGNNHTSFSINAAKFIAESYLSSGLSEEENGVYSLQAQLAFGETRCAIHFSVHVDQSDEEAKASRIQRYRLMDSSVSPRAVSLMKGWIQDCEDNHRRCDLQCVPELPTRVLDVGTEVEGVQCVLVETANVEPGNYIALSHCWGLKKFITTTTSTIMERKAGINLESMPPNFQDAVRITRLFGIRYLWIDSLCILQDSKADWEREGSKMNMVYKNAWLVVAAVSASMAFEGFLARPSQLEAKIPLRMKPQSPNAPIQIYLRRSDGAGSHIETDITCGPWSTRAWTVQEQYMARRILHFAKTRFYFECYSGYCVEDNEPVAWPPQPLRLNTPYLDEDFISESDDASDIEGDDDDDGQESALAAKNPHESSDDEASTAPGSDDDSGIVTVDFIYEKWYQLLGQYTDRNLTYWSDKLPAISGLVREFIAEKEDRYLAGIWEGDLAYGLRWMPNSNDSTPAENYRAPSWSWASFNCLISFPIYTCTYFTDRPEKPAFELLKADVKPAGLNEYGEVERGSLVLKSIVVQISLAGPFQRMMVGGKLRSRFEYDVIDGTEVIGRGRFDDPKRSIENDQAVFGIPITKQIPETGERSWSGLLLEAVHGEEKTYRRIGLFLLYEEHLSHFDGMEDGVVTLI